jgi:hypothetical protein
MTTPTITPGVQVKPDTWAYNVSWTEPDTRSVVSVLVKVKSNDGSNQTERREKALEEARRLVAGFTDLLTGRVLHL